MTALKTENLPSAWRDEGWEIIGTIELHFAWTVALATMVEREEFYRRSCASPLPTYYDLIDWYDGRIYVAELRDNGRRYEFKLKQLAGIVQP